MHIGKSLLLVLILILFHTLDSNAQFTFRGRVLEDSTAKTPVYQATVSVTENNQPIGTVSTYFDGAFAINVKPGKSYVLKISSPGLKDRQLSFLTDKKGNADMAAPTVILIKDGLRLVGRVIDDKTNLPISRATVILKDVQTRSETYSTSGSDGMYNLKLNFETNYRVFVDKRSPGIFNQYEDTTFFISTVGFTMPLDYRLDIRLEKAEKLLPSYGEYEDPSLKTIKVKPVIDVKAINDSMQKLKATNDSLPAQAPTLKLEEPKTKEDKPSVTIAPTPAAPKVDKKDVKAAENRLKDQRDSVEQDTRKREFVRAKKILDSLAIVKQAQQDSIRKIKPVSGKQKKADKKIAIERQKAISDSLQKVQLQAEVRRSTVKADSMGRIRKTYDSIQLVKKALQAKNDSIAKSSADDALKQKQAKNDSAIASKFTNPKMTEKLKLTPPRLLEKDSAIFLRSASRDRIKRDTITRVETAVVQQPKRIAVVNPPGQKDVEAVKVSTPATVNTKEIAATKPANNSVKGKSLGVVYFVKNNSSLTAFSKTKLKAIADQLKAVGAYQLSLESYAGFEEANAVDLSDKRAAAVKQELIQMGVDAGKITLQANGFSRPFNDCHNTKDCTEQKLILNRRVEMILK